VEQSQGNHDEQSEGFYLVIDLAVLGMPHLGDEQA